MLAPEAMRTSCFWPTAFGCGAWLFLTTSGRASVARQPVAQGSLHRQADAEQVAGGWKPPPSDRQAVLREMAGAGGQVRWRMARHVSEWCSRIPVEVAASFMFWSEQTAIAAIRSSGSIAVQSLLERTSGFLLNQELGQCLALGCSEHLLFFHQLLDDLALLVFLEAADGRAAGLDRCRVGLLREDLSNHALAVETNLCPIVAHVPQEYFLFFPPLGALFFAELEVLHQMVMLVRSTVAAGPGLVAHCAQHPDVEKQGKPQQHRKPMTFHQILSFG